MSERSPRRGVVWLVEDSPLEARLTTRALGPDYLVELFPEGNALLERLADDVGPDVLVLDWQLPGLSGVEICRFVRETRDEITLPVLLLTATRVDTADLVEALGAGANDFVPKPFIPEELQARIHTLARVKDLYDRVRRAELERTEALARERAAAAERDRAAAVLREEAAFRERFIGILGHDLRTPLAAVQLSVQSLLRRKDLPEPAHYALQRVLNSTGRMARMIADLLDFTRSREGGGIPIAPTRVDLHAACRRVLSEVETAYPQRDVALATEGTGGGTWDADRIEQVVSNLVVNALDYSPAGTPVRVSVRALADGVVLEVNNQGPPIPAAARATLFDPFRRGPQPDARRQSKGLGLGLYIVDQIVRAHGGSVDVTSNDASGTTFVVRLPRSDTGRRSSVPGAGGS